MKKAIYIHGLGGSGNGSSAKNVKKMLESVWPGDYDFSASTYNLLEPEEAFDQIQKDVKDADLVVASSLGAFYAVSVHVCTKILLLNPCLDPEKAIPKILYPEQKQGFDEERAVREWGKIKQNWQLLDREDCGMRFGVFSDKDELFSFFDTYKENFGTCFGTENSCMIHGTHEIAKDKSQLAQAFSAFKKYGELAGKIMAGQSSYCFGDENDFFNLV
ncbi:MAG: hypothetical protein K6E51_02825 [Treponema sp.]|nr:hypothetical protein [Treponema sp.]